MFGGAAEKLQNTIDKVSQVYDRVAALDERVASMAETVADTNERVETLETELADQRVLLEAMADELGIDPDTMPANTTADESG